MGTSVSTSSSDATNNIVQTAYGKCPPAGSVNIVNIDDVTFDPPDNCNPPSSFVVGQTATVDATCLLSSLQQEVAQTAQQLDSQARTGLGFSVSTSSSDTQNNLSQYTSQQCEGSSTTNYANIKDVTIEACQFRAVQDATDNQACQINQTQGIAAQVGQKIASSSTGFFGSPGGIFVMAIVAIVVLIIVIVAVYFMFKEGKKHPEVVEAAAIGGGNNAFMRNKLCVVIIIIAIIFLVVFLVKTSQMSDNNKLNESDVSRFTQSINDAYKIAGLKSNSVNGFGNFPLRPPLRSLSRSPLRSPSRSPSRSSYNVPYNDQNDITLDDFYKPLI
ncbi:MAG: IMV envelope protein [Satyrvirus sp.]|uniref:IMV envelope protein n=1 Tax=Satyrvirus sp. TaxID=2487771 RepID=A0A3G5AD17_9VIRU|nr:MAG: IMV envelope protein [Satyrvirus sp.]